MCTKHIKVALPNVHWFSERMGGGEKSVVELINLLKDEIDFSIISGYYKNKPQLDQKINVHLFKYKFGDVPFKFLEYYLHVKKYLKQYDFDLVHAKYVSTPISHKPHLLELHQPFFSKNDSIVVNNPLYRLVRDKAIYKSDAILVHSNMLKEWLIHSQNIKEERIHVIPYGKDKNTYHPSESRRNNIRKELNIENKFVFFYPARINKLKNQSILIEVFNQMPSKIKRNIFFIFSGTIEDKQYYLDLKKKTSISNFYISDNFDKILEYYDACDCLISTSIHKETFGQILIEGMAMKKPLLIPKQKVFIEVAKDAALYHDANSVKEIQDNIISIYNEKQIITDLVEKGTKLFNRSYTLEAYKSKMLKLYKSLL